MCLSAPASPRGTRIVHVRQQKRIEMCHLSPGLAFAGFLFGFQAEDCDRVLLLVFVRLAMQVVELSSHLHNVS